MNIRVSDMRINQNSMGKYYSLVVIIALFCMMTAVIIPGVNAASAVNLGSAGNYAILAKTGISTTGTTSINGNIGVSPIAATAITGFGLVMDPSNQFSRSSLVNGGVYAANYVPPTPATLTSAVSAMETAYTSAAGQVPPDATELYAGNLGGKTLAPGVYKWSTGVLIPSSTSLTLDAKGNGGAVWVFQIAGDLTMNSGSQVVLANGANADNVYWQVAGPSGAIIGSGAHAAGNILTQKAVTMNSGASLNGRALAQSAVTLIADTINSPSPSSVPAQSGSGTGDNSYNTGGTPSPTLAPGQTATPEQTLAPGQTATPEQTLAPGETPAIIQTVTMIPTSPPGALTKTVTVNVGGDSVVNRVDVTGTGQNHLVVTGKEEGNPGINTDEAPGTVYQYVVLTPAQYSTIDSAMISFPVRDSWLSSLHITPQDVVMYGLTDSKTWTALPTSYMGQDGAQDLFTATSPGFFLRYAITGQNAVSNSPISATVVTEQPSAVTVTPAQPAPVAAETTAAVVQLPTPTPTPKSPVPAWVPVTATLGALLIMAVLSGRRGKQT
jgi:PGF-pre-PGF domain-containing protein